MDTRNLLRRLAAVCSVFSLAVAPAFAQAPLPAAPGLGAQPGGAQPGAVAGDPLRFRISNPTERLEMIINSSRILEFGFDVPRMLVNNPDIIAASPLTPNSVQISGRKQGYTQINVWDPAGKVTTIDVMVIGDVRELEQILKENFPDAGLRLRPLNSSLYISGFVPKAEMVGQIVRVAEDFFPKVVNNITVGGVQKVLLHVKVMEVSRTKLRTMGFDWAYFNGNDFIINGAARIVQPGAANALGGAVAAVGNNNVRFGIVDGANQFYGFLELLQQNNLAKLLAEPTLTTMSGRPASFNVGGEIPVPLLSANGAPSILFREFGTQIDFVPIVLGNGMIRLEVRPAITEVDSSLAVQGVPGFRSRRADVGVEMRAGQTLAIAGLVYSKTEAETKGVPVLMDLPWVGAAFRRVTDKTNEVELVITVRPEFAAAMDPCETPPCGPGMLTTYPNEVELYGRGYIEVPKCCDDGAIGRHGMPINQGGYQGGVPAGAPMVGGHNQAQGGMMLQDSAPYRPAAIPTQQQPAPTVQPAGSSRRPGTYDPNASYNPQGRVNPVRTASSGTNSSATGRPGLIGPLGYDELK